MDNLWSGYDLDANKQNTRCLAVNTILEGKYLVGPVLGQGGFGITYLGYDLNMESKIAIKEYFPVELVSRDTTTMHGDRVLSLGGDKSATYQSGLKKYVEEARNVSRFSQAPGVVSVKDFFYANETAYIVMEFIDGISLKEYLQERGGRLPEEEALGIMKPALEALAQIHQSGMAHRDISPDNIMVELEKSGGPPAVEKRKIKSVKLIDFGSARMTKKNDQKSLTIILKHGYAPEEQYRTHGEQGAWTDVYALCAVFYRMLTGETPAPAMDRMFQDGLKSFAEQNAKVSAHVAKAIFKGLAVKKDDRIQSVGELMAALYEGKAAGGRGRAGKEWAWAAGAGIGAACILAAALALPGAGGGGKAPEQAAPVAQETVANAGQEDGAEELYMEEDGTDGIGGQIAAYHPQNSIASDNRSNHVLICKPDGTVEARGSNSDGQCNVLDWSHMVSVKTGSYHSLGLREDGTVVAAGDNSWGQCDVTHWRDVVEIHAEHYLSLGVTKNGDVLVAGAIRVVGAEMLALGVEYVEELLLSETQSWTGIKCLALQSYVAIAGLTEDGTLMIAGTDVCEKLDGWDKVERIWFNDDHIIGMDKEGNILTANPMAQEDAELLLSSGPSSGEWYDENPYASLPQMRQVREAYADGVDIEGNLVEMVVHPTETSTRLETDYPQAVEGWDDLLAVDFIDRDMVYGLKSDGTVLEYFHNEGGDEIEAFHDLEWIQLLGEGNNEGFGLLGRTADGKYLYYGSGTNRWPCHHMDKEVDPDNQLVSASADMGLYEDGSISCFLAEMDFPSSRVKSYDSYSSQHFYWFVMEDGSVCSASDGTSIDEGAEAALEWTDMIQVVGTASSAYGLKADGTVLHTGMPDGVYAAEGKRLDRYNSDRTVLLKQDGTVELMWDAAGDVTGSGMAEGWSGIEEVALGESHIVGLKADGTVVAAGSNHSGQCEVEAWTDIVMIDAGMNCTVGLTGSGELMVAGVLH